MPHQLLEPVFNTLEIKKSKFITWLVPVTSKEDVNQWLDKARTEYPDARHYCFAYTFEVNGVPKAAMSDDGEPSGTAGKPLLNVLNHKPDANVLIIVIRYFGGIKLGAGGLVRAYSQAAELAFQQAQLELSEPRLKLSAKLPFAQEQWFRHQISSVDGHIINADYADEVTMEFEIYAKDITTTKALLANKQIAVYIENN